MVMEGHVKGILSTAFSPNGYHVATGSEDNTARLWDLRKKGSLYTFPAHQSTVAMVREHAFHSCNVTFPLTCHGLYIILHFCETTLKFTKLDMIGAQIILQPQRGQSYPMLAYKPFLKDLLQRASVQAVFKQ